MQEALDNCSSRSSEKVKKDNDDQSLEDVSLEDLGGNIQPTSVAQNANVAEKIDWFCLLKF